MRQKAPFARRITSRSSSSMMPSTAASNTVRRRSSDSRSVSLARCSRASALSVSLSATSFWMSASWTSRWAWAPRTWFTRIRSTTPTSRIPMSADAWTGPSRSSISSVATRPSAPQAVVTDSVVSSARPYRAGRMARCSSDRRGIVMMSRAISRLASAIGSSISGTPGRNVPRTQASPKISRPAEIPHIATNRPMCATLGSHRARAP